MELLAQPSAVDALAAAPHGGALRHVLARLLQELGYVQPLRWHGGEGARNGPAHHRWHRRILRVGERRDFPCPRGEVRTSFRTGQPFEGGVLADVRGIQKQDEDRFSWCV